MGAEYAIRGLQSITFLFLKEILYSNVKNLQYLGFNKS